VIHETYNPGAVVNVSIFNSKGEEVRVWSGVYSTPPTSASGVSTIPIKVNFKIDRIKIYIDSLAIKGWNEIDAIGLKGSDGKIQWAQSVNASSTFATSIPSNPFVLRPAPPTGDLKVNEIMRLQRENQALRRQVQELKKALDQVKKSQQKSKKN